MTTNTVRPVYAVRLAADGSIVEGNTYIGEAATREDAIAECVAEGHEVIVEGGLIGIEDGAAFGEDRSVWAVTVAV